MNLNEALAYLKKYENTDDDPPPRYYFRGQVGNFDTIAPSISRKPKDVDDAGELAVIRGQAYTVCRLAYKIANGIRGTGSGLTTEDGLALMQHYGWVSPLIDVTGTMDVAVFFAFLGHQPGRESVIYVFDRKKAGEDIQIINHDFLLHQLEEGGLNSRWLKQDGYAITIRDHLHLGKVLQFDLKKSACLVDTVKFSFEAGEFPERQDYLELAGDPLPRQVQGLIRSLADQHFEGKLARYLEQRIDAMVKYEKLPVFKFEEIGDQILKFGSRFTVYFLTEALVIMRDERVMDDDQIGILDSQVKNISGIRYWDDSVYASVDFIFSKIERRCAGSDIVKGLVERCFNVIES